MNNMMKKAQAEVITTVLIILLVLAAIVIVWQVVSNTIEESSSTIEGTTSCISIGLEIVSIDVTADTVQVSRKSGGDAGAVNNVKFLVNGVAEPHTLAVGTFGPLDSKTFTGVAVNSGDKVEIAAILTDGTVCNVMDTATAP